MRCEAAQAVLSARLDGELIEDAVADEHLRTCDRCRAFASACEDLRHRLRVLQLGPVPDVVGALERGVASGGSGSVGSRRPALVQLAAAFAVAALVAGTLVWASGPGDVARADVAESVLEAQREVASFQATVVMAERGWHPDVPERRFEGRLAYEAPESLVLELRDRTGYPDATWLRNDVDVVVRDGTSWNRGLRDCPVTALPTCTPTAPRLEVVTGREPFSAAEPLPLDLVVPVTTFRHARGTSADRRRIAGRDALVVTVTAAQAAPMLEGLRPTGNLRSFHPTDRVQLWLDADRAVPLRIEVAASDDLDRRRWAAAQGYVDRPGLVILEVAFDDPRLNDAVPPERFAPPPPGGPAPAATIDERFVEERDVSWVPVPALSDRMRPHRAGSTAAGAPARIGVRSWSDGREWVKVSAAVGWSEPRLFGTLGEGARRVELADGGVGYLDAAGSTVALHGGSVEVAVTGSSPLEDLLAIAASLPGRGRPVPKSWAEATFVDREAAIAALPSLLLPAGLEGFAPPGFRVDHGFVTAVFGGAGERSFTLTQGPGGKLAPPLDVDLRTVTVRDTTGRWSPARGELEWREEGLLFSLRSPTIALEELLLVAASLERP